MIFIAGTGTATSLLSEKWCIATTAWLTLGLMDKSSCPIIVLSLLPIGSILLCVLCQQMAQSLTNVLPDWTTMNYEEFLKGARHASPGGDI